MDLSVVLRGALKNCEGDHKQFREMQPKLNEVSNVGLQSDENSCVSLRKLRDRHQSFYACTVNKIDKVIKRIPAQ